MQRLGDPQPRLAGQLDAVDQAHNPPWGRHLNQKVKSPVNGVSVTFPSSAKHAPRKSYTDPIQDWEKLRYRHALLELKAPQAGVVKDLATHTPGTILLTVVPKNEPLVAEVWVSNVDAGFVQATQRARVKLAAYPFQKYGMLDGIVRRVSVDAQERSDGSNGARALQDAAYRTLIELNNSYLENQGRRLRLVPGMLVNAEIHLGTRGVLEYLLSPIQKVAHEAGRER